MADWKKGRKSTNIEDFRNNPAAADAQAMGEAIQRQIDKVIVVKAEVAGYNSPEARSLEKDMAYKLDAIGTKGKGRLGGGRGYMGAVQRTINRLPPRVKFK